VVFYLQKPGDRSFIIVHVTFCAFIGVILSSDKVVISFYNSGNHDFQTTAMAVVRF